MVMLLLVVGLLLVGGLRQQLDAAVRLGNDEHRYLRAFNQALSSLSWGASLDWPRHEGWQCRQFSRDGLTACLLMTGRADEDVVLRGEGQLPGEARSLRLYQRARMPGPADDVADVFAGAPGRVDNVPAADGALRMLAQGWLDFCPLREEGLCENDD
ncbi:DUF2509 family protein [Affinibrenneria salicis]|nr:DUF2509 family protein [Affinibrenneria salicis]